MNAKRMQRSKRNFKLIAAAAAVCGLAQYADAQTAPYNSNAFNDAQAEPGEIYQTAGNGEYFDIQGSNSTYPTWAVLDFKTSELLTQGTDVSGVSPNVSVNLYNDYYSGHSTPNNVTLSFYLATDTSTADTVGTTALQYEPASGVARGLNAPGQPGSFAAGTNLYLLGSQVYNSTGLTDEQELTYNFTLPSAPIAGETGPSAQSYLQSTINAAQNVRLVITSNETDSDEATFYGNVFTTPPPPQLTFNLSTAAVANINTSSLYLAPSTGVTVTDPKDGTVNIGSYVNIGTAASPQYEYAIYKGANVSVPVTLGNSSKVLTDTLNYKVIPQSPGADNSGSGPNNPIGPQGTDVATVGFSSSDTSGLVGGDSYTGSVQFVNNNNPNDGPVTVTASTNVIEGRFLDAGSATQAPDLGKVLVGATATAPVALNTTNTDTEGDLSPDALTTLTLLPNVQATPYSYKDAFTGAVVGTLGASSTNTSQTFNGATPGTANASITVAISGEYGNGVAKNGIGTQTTTNTATYTEFSNNPTGPETEVVGEGLPGETNDDDNARVYVQWTGYQALSVSSSDLTTPTNTAAAPGDTVQLTNAASNDNVYTANGTSINQGLRADAWVTGITFNQSGWSQTALSAVTTDSNNDVLSGTVIPGGTNGSSVTTTVNFSATNMINGTYSAVMLVGLENEQDITGSAPNDGGNLSVPLNAVVSSNPAIQSGHYTFNGGGLVAGPTDLTGSFTQTGGTATFGQITGTGTLSVSAGDLILAAGAGTSQVSGLSVTGAGTLDLTTNLLKVNYTTGHDPVAAIRTALVSGYNKDTSTGPGIISSNAQANPGLYAVGYADGSTDSGSAAVSGNSIPATQLWLKLTLAGDATLDGIVNFPDLLVVAQNYGKTGQDWAEGDFNYDGVVNFPDLLLVAQNYGKQLSANQLAQLPSSFASQWQLAEAEIAAQPTAVPEPATTSLLAIGAFGLLARRRRNRGAV
jgi:hypothetical protein